MFRRISDTLLRWKLTTLAAGFVVSLMAIFATNETLFGKVLALKGAATQSASANLAPGDWVSAAPMPSARSFPAASLLPSGNWLVVGGFRTGQTFLNDAAIYKPATNTWQTVGAIPTAHRYTAQLLNTGDVLVAGDDDNAAPNATSYLFTETATGGTWAAAGQPSIKRYQTTLSLLTTGATAGHVLMAGGYDNNCCTGASGTFKTTELYNPTTKTWSAGPAMNVARAFHTATVLANGQVLVVGGFQRDPLQAFNSAELYTPGGGWTLPTPKLTTARYAHTATLLPSGEVLVVGGTNSTTALNSIELYNPSTGQWTVKAPMTTARQLHSATLLPSGKVLIAGGLGLNNQPTNSAELYDPASNSWSDAGPLVNARTRHVAALLSCGKVIIAGGNGTTSDLNTTETYTQKDPLITLTPTTLANGIVGQTFTQQFSPTGGAAPFTYRLSFGTLTRGMTLQPDGKLTGIPEEKGSFTFTVTATDKNGCTGSTAITWQTVCPNIVISPTTLHDGIAGQSYLPIEQLASTGGTAPYSYAVTAGLLPSGMQLTSDGKLQGTPLQTGGFSFTVTVTDKFGCTGIRVYPLTINCGITAITPDVMQLPDAIRGATYAPTGLQFSTVGGCGMNTFTVSTGLLPLGLTLNPNGTFSGAPVLTGDFTFTVKVTDKCGCMLTREYKLKVICATKNCGCVNPPPKNENMVGWWPLDTDGTDIRGGHHSNPLLGTGGMFKTGIVQNGWRPSPTGSSISVPHSSDFNFESFSADAWVIVDALNDSPGMPIVWKGDPTGADDTTSFALSVGGTMGGTNKGKLLSVISDGINKITLSSSVMLPLGVPVHVAVTGKYTAPNTDLRLYINGVENAFKQANFKIQTTTHDLKFGGGAGMFSFNGLLDEIELWNEALSQPEIESIFKAGSAGKCRMPCSGVTLNLASTPSTIPMGMTGQSFTMTQFTASGGTGPYMYSATGLPPGLSLSMDGKLTGIPTQEGMFDKIKITVKDLNGCTADFMRDIKVICTPYTIQPAALPAGTAGKPYPKQTLTNNSPCPTVTYSVIGTLPPGLSFMDGMLQGTPTMKGSYSFTVTAADMCGCPSTKPYTIEVICSPYSIKPDVLPIGVTGKPYPKQTFTTDSMCQPVTYSVTGTLPPGLSFSGGMLQGTPTMKGPYSFTVTATDACGCPSMRTYNMEVICSLTSITPNNLPAGFVGTVYPKQTFTTDSMCPVTYSVVGTLPPGLNFMGGMLQGTPSTAGSFTFTVAAVDDCGCSLTKPYTILIKDCPVMPLKLFSTGVDNDKVPMSNNTPDGHYTALTPTNAPVTPIVITPPSGGVDPTMPPPGLKARWIGKPGIPGGLTYTASFYLSGCDLSSVFISGMFAASGKGKLYLNSNTTEIATSNGPTSFTTFTITSGFQAGPNKLTFVTEVAPGQVSGLLVEITQARAKCCKCIAFTLGPTELPMGKQDDPYGPVNLTASLGMPDYTYSIIGGALPAGMMLSSAGQLSGTPTAKGTFTFTVLVVDAMNCTATRDYTLVIKKRTLAWDGKPDDPKFAPELTLTSEQTKQMTLRISLEAFGNEKAVSLSLGFNSTVLSNPRVTLGADATGATLSVNTSQVAQGAIGMSLTMPGNQTLAEGSRRIFNLEFDFAAANTGAKLDFTFRDSPVARSVTDANGAALPTDAVATPVLLAQPATSVSAASYRGEAITSDQIVAVFGINLATTTQVATTVPLPTSLAGTTVKVRDSANVERLAPLFFVAPTQINYLVPAGTAAGQATILITSGNGAVSGSVVEIANVAPGIFVADASGRGLPAANALTFRADGSSSSRPVAQFDPASSRFVAVPIDLGVIDDRVFLSLFATGVRKRSSLDNVRAIIGGVEAPVSYAGDQGGFAGLDQINIELPRALAGSGLVDVVLIVDGAIANVVQINIK